jgi:hypothetical protein
MWVPPTQRGLHAGDAAAAAVAAAKASFQVFLDGKDGQPPRAEIEPPQACGLCALMRRGTVVCAPLCQCCAPQWHRWFVPQALRRTSPRPTLVTCPRRCRPDVGAGQKMRRCCSQHCPSLGRSARHPYRSCRDGGCFWRRSWPLRRQIRCPHLRHQTGLVYLVMWGLGRGPEQPMQAGVFVGGLANL